MTHSIWRFSFLNWRFIAVENLINRITPLLNNIIYKYITSIYLYVHIVLLRKHYTVLHSIKLISLNIHHGALKSRVKLFSRSKSFVILFSIWYLISKVKTKYSNRLLMYLLVIQYALNNNIINSYKKCKCFTTPTCRCLFRKYK